MVLCHGLSATRRYVVHGSKVLPRNGFRLHVFDARGHGESEPATEYTYGTMADDLGQVIDQLGLELPIVLGGHSMGCHTALTYALADPGRVAALILAGPAFTGEESDLELDRWDRRAGALESGGAAEFARVVGSQVDGPDEVRKKITELARSRAELHRHPEAVAEALRQVPRSAPFSSVRELEMLDLPALVVGSHDEFDDGHPYAVARRYAHALPQAKMISEERGESPLSWQGGRLSREIASFLELLGTADADG
jgi:pimeloyl-ACP methyl ester carboxylesterase